MIFRRNALAHLAMLSTYAHSVSACSPAPKEGIFIDSIQSTSEPNLLVAHVGRYEQTSFEPVEEGKATIDLNSNVIKPGWPEGAIEIVKESPQGGAMITGWSDDAIKIFPNTPRKPVDMSEWNLDLDDSSDEVIGTIYHADSSDTVTVSPRMAATPTIQFELPSFDPFGMFWFVSESLNRAYILYNNFTASEGPPSVAAIVSLTEEGPPLYVTYSERINGRGGAAYDDIQVASVPANSCGHKTVYYTENKVSVREGLFNFGKKFDGKNMALAYGANMRPIDAVYKVGSGFNVPIAMTMINLTTGASEEVASFSEQEIAGVLSSKPESSLCPDDPVAGAKCSNQNEFCTYGEECCCGKCYASMKCQCRLGGLACFYTDACFTPTCSKNSTEHKGNEDRNKGDGPSDQERSSWSESLDEDGELLTNEGGDSSDSLDAAENNVSTVVKGAWDEYDPDLVLSDSSANHSNLGAVFTAGALGTFMLAVAAMLP